MPHQQYSQHSEFYLEPEDLAWMKDEDPFGGNDFYKLDRIPATPTQLEKLMNTWKQATKNALSCVNTFKKDDGIDQNVGIDDPEQEENEKKLIQLFTFLHGNRRQQEDRRLAKKFIENIEETQ